MTRYHVPIISLFMSAVATGGAGPAADWGPVFRGLRMSSSVERARCQTTQPITLEVVIKNTSQEVVFLGGAALDYASFDIAVSYIGGGQSQGGRVPLTRYGQKLFAVFDAAKNPPVELKPGEERPYRFALNRMYDMTLAGTYSVAVNRAVPGRWRYDGDGRMDKAEAARPPELVSNQLVVELFDGVAPENP